MPEEKKSDLFKVRPSQLIFEEGFNPREDYGDIGGLKEEIRAQGVKDPLTGYRKGEFIVVKSGHRRTTACKELQQEGVDLWVPILLEPQRYNPEMRVLDLLTDNGGLPFTPWEQSKVIQRLVNFGWSDSVIAEKSGKSLVYIRRLQLLASAPEKAIKLVKNKIVSATLVMDLMAENKIEELLEKAQNNTLPPLNPDLQLFQQDEPVTRAKRITKSDLKPNSWKAYRKWSSAFDEKELAPDKAKIFKWLDKMAKGELTEDDFKKFFK